MAQSNTESYYSYTGILHIFSEELVMGRLGWIRQLPDFRDHKFSVEALDVLPESVDLRNHMPPIYDQGQLGSCTAHAIAAAIQYDQIKHNMKVIYEPSRLFIYLQERKLENTVQSDSGAIIRDGIKACASVGVCPEYRWAYDITKFAEEPPQDAYISASEHKIISYKSVNQDLTSIQTALASGYPIIFGITVYSSLQTDSVYQSGNVPMPSPTDSVDGGHAILMCGYDNATKQFMFRNSWGTGVGINGSGYFTLPYEYVLCPDLASDFWVIETTN